MVAVIGEALIDLVLTVGGDALKAAGPPQYSAHPGGSPFNVATGLARLGQPVQLRARLSHDAFGQQLRAQALSSGLDVSAAVAATEPTTLAVVGVDEHGNAAYDFYVTGTADWQWTAAELRDLIPPADSASEPADMGWVHTGSLASWLAPGADVIAERLQGLPAGTVISYDPNVRSALMGDHGEAVARVETFVGLADVVKVSSEDLAWLYPGRQPREVLARWRSLGPALVAVTDGAGGVHAVLAAGEPFSVPARSVTVVDTVGAGDACMAGLIDAILRSGRRPAELTEDQAKAALIQAILVAAITCTRAGADPPTAAEVAAFQG